MFLITRICIFFDIMVIFMVKFKNICLINIIMK
jgi:hypothetical protein